MNPVTVVIGGVGALLIYCAVKDKDPREVIASALGKDTGSKRKPRDVSADIMPDDTPVNDTTDTPANFADMMLNRTGN